MYELIGHPRSRTLRVIWALEEMGLDYTLDPARPRDQRVAALNGTGKVPVLRDGDVIISDSIAILTYLADKHGALTYPAGTAERARQDALMQYIVTEIDAALWLYAKHSFALPEEHRVPAVKPTARYEFSLAMDHLVAKRVGPFLAGEKFTIADIVLSHCAGWGLSIKFPLPEGEVGQFLKSLRKRPAMARVGQLVLDHS